MIELVILATGFKDGFFMDVLVPAVAGGAVGLFILNNLLKHFGYQLF